MVNILLIRHVLLSSVEFSQTSIYLLNKHIFFSSFLSLSLSASYDFFRSLHATRMSCDCRCAMQTVIHSGWIWIFAKRKWWTFWWTKHLISLYSRKCASIILPWRFEDKLHFYSSDNNNSGSSTSSWIKKSNWRWILTSALRSDVKWKH